MRVLWWSNQIVNIVCVMKVKASIGLAEVGTGHCEPVHHRPIWIFLKDLSKSIYVGTRKMVNYI